jgi:hypothetical protein
MRHPFGAVGASTLITATITAFYDFQRARGPDFFVYPDYFLFHVGRRLGDHGRLDIWPVHKEVVVADDPDRVLEAVNDRAITRLAVEDERRPAAVPDAAAAASARGRIATCLAYSASGRVTAGDVRITGNRVTEGYVEGVLDPERRLRELREGAANPSVVEAAAARAEEVEPEVRARIRAGRAALQESGVPVETYRRINLEEALALAC